MEFICQTIRDLSHAEPKFTMLPDEFVAFFSQNKIKFEVQKNSSWRNDYLNEHLPSASARHFKMNSLHNIVQVFPLTEVFSDFDIWTFLC